MRDLYTIFVEIPVQWGDMDSVGHVNNARYFTYCESARIRFFEEVGLPEHWSQQQGPALVSASCNFYRQVHYPAQLEVGVRAIKVGKSSFTLEYALFRVDEKAAKRSNATEDLVAQGESVVVWVDFEEGKSKPLPEELRGRIEAGCS